MTNANLIDNQAKAVVREHLDRLGMTPEIRLTDAEQAALTEQIAAELKKRDAVLVAHYYCDPEI